MGHARLPDFIIAGAPRAGTTSLARYLGAHPELWMAPEKEIKFFNVEYSRGLDWYRSRFADAPDEALCGEASPSYMVDPASITKMAKDVANAKLVFSLREPVDRLWSNYWMMRQSGNEPRHYEDVLIEDLDAYEREGPTSERLQYLDGSLYDIPVDEFLNHFPPNQLKFLIFERMKSDVVGVYEAACGFLGVDPTFRPAILGRVVNPYVRFRSIRLRRWAKSRKSRVVRSVIGRANTRSGVTYPPMPSDLRRRFDALFVPHNERLEKLIGFSIPEWRHA